MLTRCLPLPTVHHALTWTELMIFVDYTLGYLKSLTPSPTLPRNLEHFSEFSFSYLKSPTVQQTLELFMENFNIAEILLYNGRLTIWFSHGTSTNFSYHYIADSIDDVLDIFVQQKMKTKALSWLIHMCQCYFNWN